MRTVQMTMEEELVAQVDALARQRGMTRSALARQVLKQALTSLGADQGEGDYRTGQSSEVGMPLVGEGKKIYSEYISSSTDRRIARLFTNGRSQAVRLPREFRFDGDEVFIQKVGDAVVLTPKPASWAEFFGEVPLPSADFMTGRVDGLPQEREELS